MERKSKKLVYFLSFISLFIVGLVLLLNALLPSSFAMFLNVIKIIAEILVFVVIIINAFFYVRTKRSNVYMLLFVIFTLFLIISFILPFII